MRAELRERTHQHAALNSCRGVGGAGIRHQPDERVWHQRVQVGVAKQDLLARQIVHRP